MYKAKVYITGEAPRVLQSKRTGNEFTLVPIFVLAGSPFPEKIQIFDNPKLGEGYYTVPFRLRVDNERLSVVFDFTQAVKVDK